MPGANTTTTDKPLRAAAMILAASALIAATSVFAKALGLGVGGAPLHPFQITAGRFGFAFLALMLVLLVKRPKFNAPAYQIHSTRTFFGWLGITLLFAAVARMPVSDATAISFLNPVVAMALAGLLLGEKVGPIRWLAALIALLGALILLRPGFGAFQPAGLLALGAAMAIGLEILIIKFLSDREPPLQILSINNTIGLFLAGSMASFVWLWPTQQQWAMLAAIGLMMLAAQALYIQAMRVADASFVVPFAYSTLVFATLYDMVWFGVRPDVVSVVGALVILSGAFLLARREAKQAVLPTPVPTPRS